MFPAIESSTVRAGASAIMSDRGIDRIDRFEIETAHRERSDSDSHPNDSSPPDHLAADSPVSLQSTDPTLGTLLDVIA